MKKLTKALLYIVSFFALCGMVFVIRYLCNKDKLSFNASNDNIFGVDYITVIEEPYKGVGSHNFFDYLSGNWIKFKTSNKCVGDFCKGYKEILRIGTGALTDDDVNLAIDLIGLTDEKYYKDPQGAPYIEALIKPHLITEDQKKSMRDRGHIFVYDINDGDVIKVYVGKN